MKKLILILGIAAMMFSCSSPMDKKVNEATLEQDMTAVVKNLDSNDVKLMMGAMIALKFQGKDIETMTYGEVLEKGKELKANRDKVDAEQKVMADKAAAEEADRVERLNNVVMVSCFDKGYYEADHKEYITYKLIIKNKSDKDIRAIKGTMIFTDLFDKEISSFSLVYDESIKSGSEGTWEGGTSYNNFKDSDVALKNKDLKDMKVVWTPEQILFEDGTTLE